MEWASITGSWEFRGNDDQPPSGTTHPPRDTCPWRWPRGWPRPAPPHDDARRLLVRPSGTASASRRPRTRPGSCPRAEYRAGAAARSTLAAANFADEPAEQSANLWWPDDRAWFVATDIDLMTTYVGGSAACIADLVSAAGLEAAVVPVDQRVTWDADTVNPLPADGPG